MYRAGCTHHFCTGYSTTGSTTIVSQHSTVLRCVYQVLLPLLNVGCWACISLHVQTYMAYVNFDMYLFIYERMCVLFLKQNSATINLNNF